MAKNTTGIGTAVDNFRVIAKASSVLAQRFDIFGKQRRQLEARTAYLRQKYAHEPTVQALLSGQVWIGQTSDQVIDAFGTPLAVDQKTLATKQRQVWKFQQYGTNRYRLRITLDDGLVTAWETKE